MTESVTVLVFAEGSSDADVLVALIEAVAWADGPLWLREHQDSLGSLEGLVVFDREKGERRERCITWVSVKRLAKEHNIRLRKRGDGPLTMEVRKALAVAAVLEHSSTTPGLVMLHRDDEGIGTRDAELAASLCDENGAILALPSPCTEAWILRSANLPVPATGVETKDAAGRAGLRDASAIRNLLHRVDLTSLETAPDSLRFLVKVRERLLPRILRG